MPLASDKLYATQHLCAQPYKRSWVLKIGDIDCSQISIENVQNTRHEVFNIAFARGLNFELRIETQLVIRSLTQ